MNNNECGNNFNIVLNPNFIIGLTDASGCFSVVIRKNNIAKFGVNVGLRFQIKILQNETELLKMVKLFLGLVCYILVNMILWLLQYKTFLKKKVIPHLLKYSLRRGTKYLYFLSFKEAFDIIDKKESLFQEGINKFYTIKV